MRKLHGRSSGLEGRHRQRSHGLLALAASSARLLSAALPAGALLLQSAAVEAAPARIDRDTSASLKLATWNLDWLIAPHQFKLLREHCTTQNDARARSERSVPCDVVYHLERAGTDFAALASYAERLNADVIALQEVDGEPAARLVFHGYDFCFTARKHPQNNGFAVRHGIPHRCEADFVEISAGDSLRRGAVMTLFPGGRRAIRLMSVHLKSGCALAPLSSPGAACRGLAGQLAPLSHWIDNESRNGHRFGILGDFNRDLRAEESGSRGGESVMGALRAGPSAKLADAAQGAKFQNCFPGQMHTRYIDHILLSPALEKLQITGSFQHLTYRVSDAHRRKLSDHCPVAIQLNSQGSAFD